MKERVQKIISAAGLCSRRRAEEWIVQGKVTVNGGLARLGDTADPETDLVLIDGKPLPAVPAETVTVLLYKPRGVVTTLSDEKGRQTVAELLPPALGRLYPVGRLDQFSEGLLLMTNDGALAQRLTHPAGEVRKTYRLWVSGWHEGALALLRRPIVLDGRRIKPPEVRLLWVREATGSRQQATEKAFPLRGRCPSAHTGADEVAQRQASAFDQALYSFSGDASLREEKRTALLEITIHEGRNRQIRRMAEAAGLKTTRLQRIAEGPISLGDLKSGQWRYLTEAELRQLRTEN